LIIFWATLRHQLQVFWTSYYVNYPSNTSGW
jgi:hypothetical protein